MHKPGSLAVGAVVLAAGSASRMGHRPKCLLELDGTALIRRHILALLGAGVHTPVVVLGHHAPRIALALHGLPVRWVHNPQPDAGQVSSLRTGLQALPLDLDAVLVALADQPLITPQDIAALMHAYQQRPAGTHVVQPHVNGQPGNPVMFSHGVRLQILAGNAALGCKQWQAAHPAQVHRWTSPNPHYRIDVDTPQDIETLAAHTGHRLRWPADLTDNTPQPDAKP